MPNPPSELSHEQGLQAVLVSCLEASERGQAPDHQQLLNDHPEFAAELREFFANQAQVDRLAAEGGSASPSYFLRSVGGLHSPGSKTCS